MAKTVTSGSVSYASVADLLIRYDERRIRDLVGDDGRREPTSSLATSTVLLELLAESSGEVESACLVAEKYTAADLVALTGNGESLLKRLVCDIAFQFLIDRRGKDGENEKPWRYERALEKLQQLRDGARIFGFQETQNAGHPVEGYRTEAQIQDQALSTYQAQRFFGRRAERARL